MLTQDIVDSIDKDKIVIVSVHRMEDKFPSRVARDLGIKKNVVKIMNPKVFSGREFCPEYKEKIEGKHVYIIAPNNPWEMGPQGRIKRIEMVAEAAETAWAEKITAIPVDMPYTRQDRTFLGQPRSLRHLAKTFKASYIDKTMTVHAHSSKPYNYFGEIYESEKIQKALEEILANPEMKKIRSIIEEKRKTKTIPDFLDIARPARKKGEKEEYFDLENKNIAAQIERLYNELDSITLEQGKKYFHSLDPSPILAHYLLNHSSIRDEIGENESNLVVVYADEGARNFGEKIKDYLGADIGHVQIKKIREEPNREDKLIAEVDEEHSDFGGTIEGKTLLFPDDGMETGGTLRKGIYVMTKGDFAEKYGTPEKTIIYFTHPWLNGKGFLQPQEKLAETNPAEIITTNTNSNIETKMLTEFTEKTTILRIADYISQAILCLEAELRPEEVFVYNKKELHKAAPLYNIKRSREFHPLENGNSFYSKSH